MENLLVKTVAAEYPIIIKDDFLGLIDAFKQADLNNKKVCIITDTNVEKLYLNEIKNLISKITQEVYTYVFEAGEHSKNLDVIKDFYKYFADNLFDRKTVIVALGGGVVGDMAGFAASTYMRGVTFVQIPTTLLSQVDSSVGGKVGVDFMGNKNMIGAFYQPALVYINVSTLNTLPKKEFSAGIAEAVKYGYIIEKDFLNLFEENKERIKNLELSALKELIYKSCKCKAFIVSKDEKENGLREILNFGHTFGHSVETLSNFELLHGECVSIGMVAGLYLSYKMGNIEKEDLENAINLLKYFDLPIKAEKFNSDDIYAQMLSDKKNRNNKIHLVLIKEMGNAYTEKNLDADTIKEAINYIV